MKLSTTTLIAIAVFAASTFAASTMCVAQDSAPSVTPTQSPSDIRIVEPLESVLQAPLNSQPGNNLIPADQVYQVPSLDAPSNDFLAPAPQPAPLYPPTLSQMESSLYLPAPVVAAPADCGACRNARCSCPVRTTICLEEPNCGCTHDITVTVPGCCVGEAPVVSWRRGVLGRQIATLCWTSCDKRVKVIIPRFGGPRVRE